MSEIKEYFFYDTVYNNVSKSFEWLNVSSVASLSFTVFCSQNCDFNIDWAVNNNYDIIHTDTFSVLGGSSNTQSLNIKSRFCRFSVVNIAASPSDLQTCAFFFRD